MMPSEATASNEQITKMVNAGIEVVCMGGPPEQPSDCTLTIAPDVSNSAYNATKALIEKMGGKGKIVGLSGAINDTNTVKRIDAITRACDEYPDVELFDTITDIDNPEGSMTAVADLLAAHGDEIDGIVSTAYYPSVAMAKLLDDEAYSHITAIGIDTDQAVLDAINSGVLYGTVCQNCFGQTYVGIYTLKMLIDGWTFNEGEEQVVDCGTFIVTKDNVNDIDAAAYDVTMELMSTWTDRFTAPAK